MRTSDVPNADPEWVKEQQARVIDWHGADAGARRVNVKRLVLRDPKTLRQPAGLQDQL